MGKILTVTPKEGESDSAFAARVASEAEKHFGSAETAPDVTDVPADDAGAEAEVTPPD